MSKYQKTVSAPRGQKIVTAYPRDDSSYKTDGMKSDMSFGGSPTNLEHSLSGASANQQGKERGKKDRFD